MNKKVLIVIIIILICIIAGFFFFKIKSNQPSSQDQQSQTLQNQTPEENLPPEPVIIKTATSCDKFSLILDEITCQEAIDIAQKQYSGQISLIEMGRFKLEITKDQLEEKDFWVITIDLEEPIQMPAIDNVTDIEVGVDRATKELYLLGYGATNK